MSDAREAAGRVIDAVNAHDLDTLRGLYAPTARTRRTGWPQDGTPDDLLASYGMDFACVPDIRVEPVSTLADGAHVSNELRHYRDEHRSDCARRLRQGAVGRRRRGGAADGTLDRRAGRVPPRGPRRPRRRRTPVLGPARVPGRLSATS